MSSVNIAAILDMAKLAMQVGAEVKDVVDTFRKHGIDETVYASVIADHRTFKDFHGENPQVPDAHIEPPVLIDGPTMPPPQPADPTAAK